MKEKTTKEILRSKINTESKDKKVIASQIIKEFEKFSIKYNGVVFPRDVKLRSFKNKKIDKEDENWDSSEKKTNLIVYVDSQVRMENCKFFGNLSKFSEKENFSSFFFKDSTFYSFVNLSFSFVRMAVFINCRFEGSVSFKNTITDYANFSNSIFTNSVSFIDFSLDKDLTIPVKEKSTRHLGSGWNFSNIEVNGDISFQNRVFSSSLDFSNTKIKSKFNFLNTTIQQETSFYNTNFTDVSSFGQDVCYRILKLLVSSLGNTKFANALEEKEIKTISNIEKGLNSYLKSNILKGNTRWEKVCDVLKSKVRYFVEKNEREPSLNEEARLLESIMIEYPEYTINSKNPDLFLDWESFSKNFRKYMKQVKGETKYQKYK